jgi:hypothetical protein
MGATSCELGSCVRKAAIAPFAEHPTSCLRCMHHFGVKKHWRWRFCDSCNTLAVKRQARLADLSCLKMAIC